VEIIAIAMDLQGAEVVRPWVVKARAEYPVLVDAYNMLGERFNFKYVPLTILVDEEGRLVRGPTGTNVDKAEDRAAIEDWLRHGPDSELARQPVAATASETPDPGFASEEAELRFRLAVVLFGQGNRDEAVTHLKRAFTLDPENWLIRKQMWAVENPDRFYAGDVDYDWQRAQVKAGK